MRKIKKKLSLTLIALAISSSAGAIESKTKNPWTMESHPPSDFQIVHTSIPTLRIPLEVDGGTPEIVGWELKDEKRQIGLLRYRSKEVGTSEKYIVERGVAVDLREKKILGQAAYAYISVGNAPKMKQPEWLWSKSKITVDDREYLDHEDFEFKP